MLWLAGAPIQSPPYLDTPAQRQYFPCSNWHSLPTSTKTLIYIHFLSYETRTSATREPMAKTKFRPLHDRVVVRRINAEEKTKGGGHRQGEAAGRRGDCRRSGRP